MFTKQNTQHKADSLADTKLHFIIIIRSLTVTQSKTVCFFAVVVGNFTLKFQV